MIHEEETIYARGTLGDAFMIVLKLSADTNKINKVNHYSKHQYAYPAIKKIYNLVDNVEVNFLQNPLDEDCVNGFMEAHETWNPHPTFNLPRVEKFNLPVAYSIVQLNSGLNQKWRNLNQSDVKKIPVDIPVVVVGTDNLDIGILSDHTVLDLRNKTTIEECLSIIRQAKAFYGPQGFLSFFALSQKVNSNIFLKNQSDIHATNVRVGMIKEWQKYVKYRGITNDY